MANYKKCGCRRSDGDCCGYGTLNYVSGPYYTGGCGPTVPCKGCCCNAVGSACGCGADGTENGCCRRRRCCCRGIALYTAQNPQTIPAGGTAEFTEEYADENSFELDHGRIRFLEEGTYLVQYTVNIPAGTAVESTFALELNGASIAGSEVNVVVDDDATANAGAQAIVRAGEDSQLTLTSSEAITVDATAARVILFSILIIRLC